jgi:hypothetical protein
MEQSVYTQISKAIGFQGTADIPSINKANELLAEIRGDDHVLARYAFREVFKIYRFAPSPENKEQSEALDVICAAFKEGEMIYRNIYS